MNTQLDAPSRFETSSEPSIASLVGGIVTDAQELIKQQFILLSRELAVELRRAKTAAISMSVGSAIAAVGGFLLLLMLVHLISSQTAIPLWGSYGIVGGLITAIGLGLFLLGRKEAGDVSLAPPPQTAETLKENWQWLKRQTVSHL